MVCDGVGLGFGADGGDVSVGFGAGADDDDLVGCGAGALLDELCVVDGAVLVVPLLGLVLVP